MYAYDIAKLPQWQQRVWAGFNIAPNGPVSAELLASQMHADPAETIAPEQEFADLLVALDAIFIEFNGSPLFSAHDSREKILSSIHRFRALEPTGLLELAKDIARLTADSIDITALRKIVIPPTGTKWGSLKFLENVLATKVRADEARKTMTPLFGVYELRLGDAHLPSSKLQAAYEMANIDTSASPLEQGLTLLDRTVGSLRAILEVMSA